LRWGLDKFSRAKIFPPVGQITFGENQPCGVGFDVATCYQSSHAKFRQRRGIDTIKPLKSIMCVGLMTATGIQSMQSHFFRVATLAHAAYQCEPYMTFAEVAAQPHTQAPLSASASIAIVKVSMPGAS
jgi:hypothetical protein